MKENDEMIRSEEATPCGCMNERGICMFLSEETAARIAMVAAGTAGILTLPFLILTIMLMK